MLRVFLPFVVMHFGVGAPECDVFDDWDAHELDTTCGSHGEKHEETNKNSGMARLIRDGSTLIINASSKHTATVILTHGLGDTAEGWSDAAGEMAKKLPYVKWVLPTAPSNPVTLNGGYRMPSWYDIESLSRSRAQQGCKGIEESTTTLHNLIRAEVGAGIEMSRIVLAGFSQGGAMSLWAGLQLPSSFKARLGGVVVLSGYLPKEHDFSMTSFGKETPVLHCHGTADPVVILSFAEESKVKIINDGHTAGYELRTYNGMAHSASMQELLDVVQWLSKVLPPTTS